MPFLSVNFTAHSLSFLSLSPRIIHSYSARFPSFVFYLIPFSHIHYHYPRTPYDTRPPPPPPPTSSLFLSPFFWRNVNVTVTFHLFISYIQSFIHSSASYPSISVINSPPSFLSLLPCLTVSVVKSSCPDLASIIKTIHI